MCRIERTSSVWYLQCVQSRIGQIYGWGSGPMLQVETYGQDS